MKAASIAAYDNLHGNGGQKWNAKNVREYLKEEGLNEPLIKDIIKCVSKDEMLKILPPCWNTDGDVNNHIETIMHLVFLGVSQTVSKVLKETMTAFNQFAAFHNNDNELRNIRSLQLDWCKTWIFGSQKTPFGPWVSENTLAYVRVMKHIYTPLDNIPDVKVRKKSKLLVQAMLAMVSRIMQKKRQQRQ